MLLLPSSLLLLLVVFFDTSIAFHVPIVGRRGSPAQYLKRRGNLEGTLSLDNSQNVMYFTNLTLNGEQFTVVIDTGSSDLWVKVDKGVPKAKDTGANASIHYAAGAAGGPIKLAELNFAGYDVKDQAYLEVSSASDSTGTPGIIGLGPNAGSNIQEALMSSTGYGPLDRIFLQDRTTPNYITFLLGRLDDPDGVYEGDMTVGSILQGYEKIGSQPSIPLIPAAHYEFLGDADSVVAPNGKAVQIKTAVKTTKDKNRPTFVLDTGFSLSQVTPEVAKALYSGYDGAELVQTGSGSDTVWIVPCTTEVNFSFKFAGVDIPIHPLDATLDPAFLGYKNVTNSKGVPSCVGSFQPITFDAGGEFDILLGMSFIRNVYLYLNLGDFVGDEIFFHNGTRGDPYVKFLPTTNLTDAHNDFEAVRNHANTTAETTSDLSTATGTNGSGSSHSKSITIIVAVVAGTAALILGAIGFYLYSKRTKVAYKPLQSIETGHIFHTTEVSHDPLHNPYAGRVGRV